MIVFNRSLKKEDVKNFEKDSDDDELIYYRDNNIAFTIHQANNNFIVRKKKIFNNEMIDERFLKTVEQVIKVVD